MNDPKSSPSEDIERDPPDTAPVPPPGADAEAGDRVTALEAQVADLRNQLLRALAEAENTRRRAQKEREDTAKYAVSAFAKELVGVSDNLHRALEAVPPEAVQENESVRTLIIGIEAIERQLAAVFEQAGIRKIEPLGEMYDPNFHQVMFEVENTGKPPGTIVQLLQAGYIIHDRLLREAMVGVARGEPAQRKKVDTVA